MAYQRKKSKPSSTREFTVLERSIEELSTKLDEYNERLEHMLEHLEDVALCLDELDELKAKIEKLEQMVGWRV